MGATKIGDILEALCEVRANLDRRAQRAYGALLVIWGVAGAAIFGFYQLVAWNPAPYAAALGPWLEWAWVGPLAVGYAAGAVVGARMGRLGFPEARHVATTGIGVTLGVILLLGLLWFDQYDRIPGMWLLVLAGLILTRLQREGRSGPLGNASLAVGTVAALSGAWILVAPFALANGVAAAVFLLGCGTLGTLRYLGLR